MSHFCITLYKWKWTVKWAEWISTQLARLMVHLMRPVKWIVHVLLATTDYQIDSYYKHMLCFVNVGIFRIRP